ncbi:sensor domain-containing diguanylate cyclase [Aminipila terrae]|uniref:Diguanylate cyclase n=1 Tax=Aminipila terrae TaxID=2697030 RepID=A0A6P1MEZ5_9FIRM|nr:sensor domain-containing diguanylate cyclase [Aminipila terrae]QHI71703.1 diguanylate cyclase [Aminipila terrae]
MKKHILLISNLIIILSIVAGFIGIVNRDTRTYQDLVEHHLENIVSLADTDISKHIENSMTKPVMVSKTMANDEFLKEWLSQEKENVGDSAYLKQLYEYLKAYQKEYNYTTVFCISAQTDNYYYQNGLNKTVSNSDPHDVWYYNFIKSGREYDLQVDTNESNKNNITVFVNFRVESSDGRLLGVIGVGLQVASIEEAIHAYEDDYDLSVYIINAGGAKNSFTGDTEIFVKKEDLTKRTGIRDKIEMNNSDKPKMQWFTSGDERKCVITKYDDTLGWYLVLEKDTNSISSMFQKGIKGNIVFMLISLVICIMVTTTVFLNYNKRMVAMENIDELTGLPNRKLFFKRYAAFVRKHREQRNTMFMFDIDHFKCINDTYGHMFGNAILAMVGEELRQTVNEYGIGARWGGDEFLGILAVESQEAEQILQQLMDKLKKGSTDNRYHVTISVGMAEINPKLSTEQMVNKVDEALYCSKEGGRNKITVCKY